MLTLRLAAQKGAMSMFAEAMQSQKKAAQYAAVPTYIPDLTFLTGINSSDYHGGGGNDADTDAIADDVMQKVAAQMGILNSAELLRLRDRVKLPPKSVTHSS